MALTTLEYKKWRKQAAKQFKCTEAAIDQAVEEGCNGLRSARNSNNPIMVELAKTYGWMTSYSAGFMWYLYSQNPALNLLMNAAGKCGDKSPYTRPIGEH